ncbi:MAG: hypothetical protein M3R16_08230 [Pseudomonadota bacterium]|nr:hypothetical protein [Pseudomonadota bacterium]
MRDYGKVHTGFWASETLRELDADAKLLALYLLTSPHTTMIGAFHLPAAYACEDLSWNVERFRNGLETLSKAGFSIYCEKTRWVWIVKFLTFNRPENPNQWKSAGKLITSIPENASFKNAAAETVVKPLNNTPVPAPVPVPVLKAETQTEHSQILGAYHALLPKCQQVSVLGPKRKRLLTAAVKQARQVCRDQGWPYVAEDFWHAYFTECASDTWLRGDKANPNNPEWRQKLETLIDETRFSAVMDKAIAAMRADA